MSKFSEETVLAVWQKASVVPGYNPDKVRKDYAGAWIKFEERGCDHAFGWEIDHLKPVCEKGCDELYNLLPLHWENNRCKADNYPNWETSITSSGNKNTSKTQKWHIKK